MSSIPSLLSPSRRIASLLSLALLALAVPACAAGADANNTAPAIDAPTDIVAKVGSTEITMEELEESLAPQLAELERQKRKILEDGIQGVVDSKLLELEAGARGVSLDQLFQAEIEAKVDDISDEEVAQFYEQNKARINRPLEQMTPQIRTYLGNQKRNTLRGDLLSGLRQKYPTRILLEPTRADVFDASSPAKGPADAAVTIVEFSDFQCPYCKRVNPTIDQAMETYGDKLRVIFRQYPLSFHQHAQKAAEASLCAHEQGKFWELHDAMFANQAALGVDQLKAKAAELGMQADQFNQCLDSSKYQKAVAQDFVDGQRAGVSGTPAMFVNGRFLSGAVPFETLARLIDDEIARQGS